MRPPERRPQSGLFPRYVVSSNSPAEEQEVAISQEQFAVVCGMLAFPKEPATG